MMTQARRKKQTNPANKKVHMLNRKKKRRRYSTDGIKHRRRSLSI